MKEQKDNTEKMIEQAIRQVGQERDAQDLATLKQFMTNRKQKSKTKQLFMAISSVAAILAIVFSLNIYQENRRMDKAFETYYAPLEYDSQLMSRGEDIISSELSSAMIAYQNKDYPTALQQLEAIPDLDENFLIYKAICYLELEQTNEAISLLEQLVDKGEGTEYYQQACWYLALAYLRNHDDEKALEILKKNNIDNNKDLYKYLINK